MGYTRGPYTAHSSLPVPPRPKLHSSRKIDAQLQRYELDVITLGNVAMGSVAQRVLVIVSTADIPQDFVTDQGAAETRSRLVSALSMLTDGPAPTIKLLELSVGSNTTGSSYRRVKYRNLTTGLDETVQA